MKKLLILLLPLSFLFADETKLTKEDSYCYLNFETAHANQAVDLLYPYIYGVGYRYKIENNALDVNINIPYANLANEGDLMFTANISYLRMFPENYYACSGINQEFGKQFPIKFYKVSPFIGFGKEFHFKDWGMFAQIKCNFLTYYPYIGTYDDYYFYDKKETKKASLKYSFVNLCYGFFF